MINDDFSKLHKNMNHAAIQNRITQNMKNTNVLIKLQRSENIFPNTQDNFVNASLVSVLFAISSILAAVSFIFFLISVFQSFFSGRKIARIRYKIAQIQLRRVSVIKTNLTQSAFISK
jgi:hypothetical protein